MLWAAFDQTPRILATPCVCWLRGDRGVTADGFSRVSLWADLSGNGHDHEQSTDADKPIYTGSIGDVPTLDFTPNDFLDVASGNWSANLTQPVTHGVVSEHDTAGNEFIFGNDDPGAAHLYRWSSTGFAINAGSTLQGGTHDANPHHSIVICNGGSSKVRVDGSEVASGNAGTEDHSKPRMSGGTGGAPGSNFYDGRISERVIWDGLLGADDIARVEAYFEAFHRTTF